MSKARDLDQEIVAHRDRLDREIANGGSLVRLKRELAQHATTPLATFDWRRLAAAVALAGMLGGALDLMLPEPIADQPEIAILDPLDLEGGAQE
jgi:hypothetical protein